MNKETLLKNNWVELEPGKWVRKGSIIDMVDKTNHCNFHDACEIQQALNEMAEPQVVYKHKKPYGIRDASGFLLFFPEVTRFTDQEERYTKEIEQQCELANCLLTAIKQGRK